MTFPPPNAQRPTGTPPAYQQLRIPQPPTLNPAPPQHATNVTPFAPHRETTAPTLLQFWRSDSRAVPGRRPPRWAGHVAFWLGLLAAGLHLAGVVLVVSFLVALAAPFALVALLFALIAIIAGVGRGLGILGLLLALAGSSLFWAWLATIFG